MATAGFTATNRVGDGIATVTFNDASTGTIVSRKWILGDGTVVEGNLTSVVHTYTEPGEYDVILVVEDASSQDTLTRTGYVVVNEEHPSPEFVIAEGMSYSDVEYWRFRLDSQLRLVYEDYNYVHTSVEQVATIGNWSLVEFHAGANGMYAGTYDIIRRALTVAKTVNASPPALNDNLFRMATNSTIKIDEFKIWLGEKRLKDYYYETRAMAGVLD